MAKVDVSRIYAIAAFARWSCDGRPTYESMESGIEALIGRRSERREEQRTDPSKPTEAAVLAAEREFERKRAYYMDMMAAEKVWNVFKDKRQGVFLECVYLREPRDVFKRGEISRRMNECCAILQLDDALKKAGGKSPESGYRYLRQVNRLFCIERGITFGDFEKFFQK